MKSNTFFSIGITFALLLLIGCKSNNSQQEPLFLDAEIEYQEYVEQPTETNLEQEAEEWADVIHIRYDKLVNGYIITVDLYPEDDTFYGPADLRLSKDNSGFTVHVDYFEEDHFNRETVLHGGDTITLKYTPLPKGKMISPDCTFFFSDVDFDGTKELLVREPLYGPRGSNGYHVFELDGTERDDDPFQGISDMTEFNASEKSITQKYYYGVILGSNHLKYRRQKDGSFALTDSTHIDYKIDFTDSIRVHYRKQGDKMVLVKKEVVK